MLRNPLFIGLSLLLAPVATRVDAQAEASPALRAAVRARAGHYPLKDVMLFGSDSAVLVFADPALTSSQVRLQRWMFGPAVTKAEEDGCPPEKVLGRQIARVFWRGLGKPSRMQQIVVRVEGGVDKYAAVTMYYYMEQLTGLWAGDPSK